MFTSRRRSTRRPAGVPALAGIAVLAAVLAGCGSGPGAGQGGLTTASSDQDMVSFTQCMRAHGVTMSDPFHSPGHQGLSIDMPPQDAATRAAYHACTHFMARILQVKQAGAAAHAAPHLAALTRYAQCMRAHDIPMLDPTAQGQLSLGNVAGISGNFGRHSPQFRTADAACRPQLPAGVRDDGTGP